MELINCISCFIDKLIAETSFIVVDYLWMMVRLEGRCLDLVLS